MKKTLVLCALTLVAASGLVPTAAWAAGPITVKVRPERPTSADFITLEIKAIDYPDLRAYAAATDVGLTLSVEDTQGLHPPYYYISAGLAPPLTETAAFPCAP